MTFDEILDKKDSDQVYYYISNMTKDYSCPDIEHVIMELNIILSLEWHHSHENITLILQRLKSPTSINVLYETALKKFDYLSYDDAYALARKCTWALADIGTTEAREKLSDLAMNDNKFIAKYANKRLMSWENELHRKGL